MSISASTGIQKRQAEPNNVSTYEICKIIQKALIVCIVYYNFFDLISCYRKHAQFFMKQDTAK